MSQPEFSVEVAKADMKFNAAHFIAFRGYRERLHGHNYTLSVKVSGSDTIGSDGYLIDFGDIKKAARSVCKEMNEYFLLPMNSDVMTITESTGEQLCMVCEDGSKFEMPKRDCKLLPLVHSSAEELAHYIWFRIVRTIGLECMTTRRITSMIVSVSEAPQQQASFSARIPPTESDLVALEATAIMVKPHPCCSDD